MKKILIVLLFSLIALFLFALIGAGSHGHIMFRPHMIEDWLLWGFMMLSIFLAIYFLIKRKK